MSDTLEFLNEIHRADRVILDRIQAVLPAVAVAAEQIAERLRRGGRWFYIGAGTSGRLGVLDAAELTPTFGIARDRVIAIIAGGREAVFASQEFAEDDTAQAPLDLDAHGFRDRDALLAIAASGTTPYVLAAIRHARRLGAYTVAFTCSAGTPMCDIADHSIAVHTGPEVLPGSSRMKAGSAQKLVLTMLSTAVMRRCGLIYQGEMVAMRPTNAKLRARAARIVEDLTGLEHEDATRILDTSDWELPIALIRARFGGSTEAARARLEHCRGSVADALEENGRMP